MALQSVSDRSFEGVKGTVAVLVADFHQDIVNGMLEGLEELFSQYPEVRWHVERTPGAFEIPLLAQRFASMVEVKEDGSEEQVFDVVVALGCVLKGDTYHFELVANECARGCMDVMLQTGVPVVFEVLAPYDLEQAKLRSTGEHNHGVYAAQVALDWLKKLGNEETRD